VTTPAAVARWDHHAGVPVFVYSACSTRRGPRRDHVKPAEEIMRVLEAFDLTQSVQAAGELAGCDHHTVANIGSPVVMPAR
jgi:hypothetical protein